MTFPTSTLSAGNYTSLRSSSWAGASYVSLVPNNVVWQTTLSATATGTTNAQIAYGSTIAGNSANVLIGQRVLIGTANDVRQATFNGRVRGLPGSGIMNINETSDALTSGMYLWVIDDYPLMDRLARPVGDPVVQYKDYDLSFQNLLPVVVGIQLGYAGWVNSSGVLRIAFNASASYAAESGRTISSYQYTFAAATYTVISGSLASSTVTVDFNPGFQWGQLVVTDSDGRTQTRHFAIWAHNDANPPQLSFQGANITANLNDGWSATVDTYADVSSMLDDTLAIIWTQEYYAGVEGPINTNIDMIGWIRHEDDPARTDPNYALIPYSTFEIAGIGSKLSRIEAQLLALKNAPSPSVWDEINNLTPWRGIVHFLQRHTTLLSLVDLTFDDTSDTFWFPYLSTQGGNALAAVNGIAGQINAAMEFAPDGAVRVVRDARFLSSSARSALLTYANWTSADYSSLTESYTHEQSLGKVDADGAFFQTSSGGTPAFRSRAPGLAQDIGPDTTGLNNQILASGTDANVAQGELNQRAGNQYEISSTPSYHLAVTHPDPYHFLIPSLAIWYTWTLTGGTDNIRGISYSTSSRWLLLDISIAINNDDGTRAVQVNYILESPIGNPGTTIVIPADGSIDPILPAIPPLDPFPAFPDPPEFWIGDSPTPDQILPFTQPGTSPAAIMAPRDGNTVLVWTSSQVWITRSFIARASPVWTEITPSGISNILDCKFTPSGQGVYILGDSATSGSTWSITFDFTANSGGFTANSNGVSPIGSWSAAGWGTADLQRPATTGAAFRSVYIHRAFSSATLTGIVATYNASGTTDFGQGTGGDVGSGLFVNGSIVTTVPWITPTGTGVNMTWTGSQAGVTSIDVDLKISIDAVLPFNQYSGSGVLTSVTLTGTGSNPFGQVVYYTADAFAAPVSWTVGAPIGSGSYVLLRPTSTDGNLFVYSPSSGDVRLSTDHGGTFSAAVTVGTTPGSVGGGDVNKVGNTSIFAADQKTRSATTLGGAYSDTTGGGVTGAEPLTVYIPRYKFGGTTTNASLAAPDFLLAASALVSSEALWKVSGGTPTAITPSTAGTKALGYSPDGANMNYLNGNVIAYLGKVSGTAHLYYSANAGGAWSDRGALSGVLSVRIRKSDRRTTPALFLSGGAILKYSKDGGATLVDRTKPVSSGLLGIEVLG